ncbi:MAG: NAD regulator [Pseudomonadota bacterium]
MSVELLIGLSAVIVAIDSDQPVSLVTNRSDGVPALPYGKFDPAADRTFELALRGWVSRQTGFTLGYVEQLYTFGDRGRETPSAVIPDADADARTISVGYLALTPEAAKPEIEFDTRWAGWYRHFPWEDHRAGRPAIIDATISPLLNTWAAGNAQRLDRARVAFALDCQPWIEERALERYELLYEAGLVEESVRDAGLPKDLPDLGLSMASDHRRIFATAISRLRGKLKYRPVLFELMPERFTLSRLQIGAEAILGVTLHKQNFRRALDRTGLVEGTGDMESGTGGRPAEVFRFRRELLRRRALSGIAAPTARKDSVS